MPNSKCLVKPVDCISRTIRPAYLDYPAIVIPLSMENYPGELQLSPKGEAVLPYWFSDNGQGRLNFQAEAGDQIILSFGLFERPDTFSGLIENPLWPENPRLSVI